MMRLRSPVLMIAMSVILAVFSKPATADLITIEHVVSPITFGAAVNRNITRAQAFTATHSGELVAIDLQIARPANGDPTDDLTVEIMSTLADGFPNLGDVRYTRVLTKDDVPTVSNISQMTEFVEIDLGGSSFSVDAGEQYVISLRSQTGSSPHWYLWATDSTDEFEGRYFYRAPPDSGWQETSFDAGFRAHVQVPEPNSAVLTGVLLAIASGWYARRRRASKRAVGAHEG